MLISGRRLGLDYGETRIGLSISDAASILVSPLMTVKNDENSDALAQISALVQEHNIAVVYIGLPLHLSGVEGQSAIKVRHFASELAKKLHDDIPMRLIDERLSTSSALQEARKVGKQLSKDDIDQWAAVAILEGALNRERLSGELAGEAL
jgi:putative Holliday junction resolvase